MNLFARASRGKSAGPDPLRLMRMIWGAFRNPIAELESLRASYGDVSRLELGATKVFVFQHPDHARAILVEQADSFSKWKLRHIASQVVGRGLLTSIGDEHKRQRRELAPAFAQKAFSKLDTAIDPHLQRLLTEWRANKTPNIALDMGRLTLAAIAQMLFDVDVWDEAHELRAAVETLSRKLPWVLASHRLGAVVQRFDKGRAVVQAEEVLDRFVARVRARHEELVRAGQTANHAFASHRIFMHEDAHEKKYARDQIVTLLITGHETMAHALTCALDLLAQNPDLQEEVAAELRKVLKGKTPTAKDVEKLSTATHVFFESLRLHPPGWVFSRLVVRDTTIDGQPLKKGNYIVLCPYLLHRDERFFDEPQRFDPSRWQEGRLKRTHDFRFLPFSVGPRACIAANFAKFEATLMLASLCQAFRFVSAGKTEKSQLHYTMKVAERVVLGVHPRGAVKKKSSKHAR